MANPWELVIQIVNDLGILLGELVLFLLHWSLVIAWLAWWLCAVNWSKVWPVLARGAWVPVVLLMGTAALVWSRLAPAQWDCFGIFVVANFWWQLGAVSLLVGATLFMGWVQGALGWTPAEVEIEPPAPTPGHAHH